MRSEANATIIHAYRGGLKYNKITGNVPMPAKIGAITAGTEWVRNIVGQAMVKSSNPTNANRISNQYREMTARRN